MGKVFVRPSPAPVAQWVLLAENQLETSTASVAVSNRIDWFGGRCWDRTSDPCRVKAEKQSMRVYSV